MSLDVELRIQENERTLRRHETDAKIYIREHGQRKAISREEWEQRFPGKEPIMAWEERDGSVVYRGNVTHNLIPMAEAAGLYFYLWRPEEIGITKARDLIAPLEKGLRYLLKDAERFEQFNPTNGWGSYVDFCQFVGGYLLACKEYPWANVDADR